MDINKIVGKTDFPNKRYKALVVKCGKQRIASNFDAASRQWHMLIAR